MDRTIIKQGFLLIFLGLFTGLLAPYMASPRMGVGAHTLAFLGGLVLIAIGATKAMFVLDRRWWLAMRYCWFAAAYGNWANTLLAAATGASYLTPIAGAGISGPFLAEIFVSVTFVVVGVTSIIGTGIGVYGLFSADTGRA